MKKSIGVIAVLLALGFAGCKKEPFKDCCNETYKLAIDDTTFIVIPNAFSPNGDNINDFFEPIFRNISSNYSMTWTISKGGTTIAIINAVPWHWAGEGKEGTYQFSCILQNLQTGARYSQTGDVCVFTKNCIEKGFVDKCQFNDGFNYDLTYSTLYHANEGICP